MGAPPSGNGKLLQYFEHISISIVFLAALYYNITGFFELTHDFNYHYTAKVPESQHLFAFLFRGVLEYGRI